MEGSLDEFISADTRDVPTPFVTTAWTLISLSQQSDPGEARRHLGFLIERYWRAVYFYIRQRGKSHDDAKDLTQEFFTHFVEKDVVSYADRNRGKFRTFLLASANRFLAQKHRVSARRPLEVALVGIDTANEFHAFEPESDETPELVFFRNWAKSIVEICVARLRHECRTFGKEAQYTVFLGRLLVEPPVSQRALAGKLGISESDVGNSLRLAKQRFRRIFRLELMNTVDSSAQVDEEVREILEVLSKP